MHIRSFEIEDIAQIVALFFDTVHTVNAKDYTAAQLQAWAPADEQVEKLARSGQQKRRGPTIIGKKIAAPLFVRRSAICVCSFAISLS